MKKSFFRAMLGTCAMGLLAGAAIAQDFQKQYRLAPGGTVSIKNVSGDVTVTGYNGPDIIVTGYKEGRDRDRVTIEDLSGDNRVEVKARYPENCRDCNVSVRFEVKVPSEIRYLYDSIATVSGNVAVSNVMGDLQAKSVSGNVTVNGGAGTIRATSVSGHVRVTDVNGGASAKSTSGNVEVTLSSLESAEAMEFTSVSGNVVVKLPASLDAEVKMSTMNGMLKTDFPLAIEEPRWGPGRRASGRLGSGSRNLKISTVSGNVSLLRS